MKKVILSYVLIFLLSSAFKAQSLEVDLEQVQTANPASFTGSIWAQSGFYDVSGIPARTNHFIWSMGANASLNLYDNVSLPFSFTIGQYGNEFHRPTFGQFGISPKYKWLTGHFGHRNLNFSSYTLNGHTFLGTGIEMNPGKFRFAAMYGRLRKATETQPNLISILPAFRRTGYGVKIGVGSDKSFVDLIAFKAKDDPESLPGTELQSVSPSENLVLGLNARFQLIPNMHAFFEIAGSAFTRDQQALELEPGDSLSVEKYIPASLFGSNVSSRFNLALKGGLQYVSRDFQMGLQFEQIDPEYETMGAYFFLNDLRNVTITPAFSLFQQRVNLSGSAGFQQNNLLGNRQETTRRFIGNGALTYVNPGKPFGMSLNYSNFTINQANGTLELSDTIRLSMVTSQVNLTPYWNWTDSIRTRSLVLSANYQVLNDRNPFTREFTDMTTWFMTGTWSHFFLHRGWGFQAGLNYNQIDVYNLDTERYGGTAGLNLNLAGGKYNTAVNGTLNLTRINGKQDGYNAAINLTAGWAATQSLNFSFYTYVLKNASSQFDDYLEFTGGVQFNCLLR